MIILNKINYNNKIFQVFMDDNQNRLILEIKNDSNFYYTYPELKDLINISKKYFAIDDIVYSKEKKSNNNKYIKFAQKVMISGMIISIVLSIPTAIKSFSIEDSQKAYSVITKIMPNRISTPQELNESFNTSLITKNDVHKAINENKNLNNYNEIIHEFVDDVEKVNPNQNWWIFHQNIKRMNIDYNPTTPNAAGTFNPYTSEILILDSLNEYSLKTSLRHELTHALSLIDMKYDDKHIKIHFNNTFSGYGRSVMELLTCSFNSYSGSYIDSSYIHYKNLFNPLINKVGETKFNNILFEGDINSFVDLCNPYFNNPYEYITHLDAVFFSDNGGDFRTKRITDIDFLTRFRNMTIDFYVNLQYEQLKSGNITYDYYISDRIQYIKSLQTIINNSMDKNKNNNMTISDTYKYLTELENKTFDNNTLINIENSYNNSNDLIFTLTYSNNTNEFKSILIDSIEDYGSTEHYNDLDNNNINNFYFIIEQINNDLKLRLINKKNLEYKNVDILTYTYIDDNANIILEIPVIDYINSIPKEIILGKNWSSNSYFTIVDGSFFNVNDIMEFANNQNYNNKISK